MACSIVLTLAFENVKMASDVHARKDRCIHKDIKSRLSLKDTCFHSFQKLLFSHLCKNIESNL